MSCDSCPLKKHNLDIQCASEKHARYCELAQKSSKYDDTIVNESIRMHNEESGDSLPPLSRQVKNFASSMVNWVKDGFKMAPKPVRDERLTICKGCEKYNEGRCLSCGCFLDYKTSIAAEKCPLDKWGAYSEGKGCGC